MNKHLVLVCVSLVFFTSCSVQKRIDKVADKFLLKDSGLAAAHVGIALYNAIDNKFIYNHDGEKYFVPASNTKLLTCYAAMKYLGDSLVGLRYEVLDDSDIMIQGNADPTFLHSDFKNQPVFDFLKKNKTAITIASPLWKETALGDGWAWNDYNDYYMAERSEFPIYGNVVKFFLRNDTISVVPHFLYSDAYGTVKKFNSDKAFKSFNKFSIKRDFESNTFKTPYSFPKFSSVEIPFKTNIPPVVNNSDSIESAANVLPYALLEDTLHKQFDYKIWVDYFKLLPNIIHSQPTDSLLKIMMHRSDNFFAEQTLLMVSNELLGVMNDEKIIDTLLKTDYKDLPQKPYWVDGSGLSHYNLITPQDEVKVLEKMKSNFNWNRITAILPTGGEGTLRIRYKKYIGKIYAKTGSLNGVIALSGFITTHKNHSYIFSVMVNNHVMDETEVRDKIEKFISTIMEKF